MKASHFFKNSPMFDSVEVVRAEPSPDAQKARLDTAKGQKPLCPRDPCNDPECRRDHGNPEAEFVEEERHAFGCVCADCSGAELTARND